MLRFVVACLLMAAPLAAQEPEKAKKVETPTLPTEQPDVFDAKPKAPTKTAEELVAPPAGDQAVLPIGLVRNRVDSLKPGSEAYTALTALHVDSKKRVWLNPHALTGARSSERPLLVKRDAVGFHVVLDGADHQWEAADIDSRAQLVPVKTLQLR